MAHERRHTHKRRQCHDNEPSNNHHARNAIARCDLPQFAASAEGIDMNGRTKSALFGAIVTLAVLAGAEGLARLAGTVSADLARSRETAPETWLAYSPTLGWERRPGFRGEIAGVQREFDVDGYVSAGSPRLASGGNARRVLFFGDSNTFGFGVAAEEAFAQQVERRVPGIAAINLGVIGYSSYQG